METSGRWIFVGRARATAHPQHVLNIGLVLSAIYFATIAALSMVMLPLSGVMTLLPILNLVTAIAIMMRWPFAYQMVLGMLGLQIGLIFLLGMFGPDPIILGGVVCGLAVGMYFVEGARPNLIYRHRYYSRKPLEDEDV